MQIHRDKGTSSAGERQSQFSILLDRFVIRLLRTQAESACRQYRAVRWFLLPEGELRRGCERNQRKISVKTVSRESLRVRERLPPCIRMI